MDLTSSLAAGSMMDNHAAGSQSTILYDFWKMIETMSGDCTSLDLTDEISSLIENGSPAQSINGGEVRDELSEEQPPCETAIDLSTVSHASPEGRNSEEPADIRVDNAQISLPATETKSPTFSCQVCNASFANEIKFKIHQKLHLEINSLEIELQSGKFRQGNQGLVSSISDTGTGKLRCDFCMKESTTLGNLKKHQQFHCREKRFLELQQRSLNTGNVPSITGAEIPSQEKDAPTTDLGVSQPQNSDGVEQVPVETCADDVKSEDDSMPVTTEMTGDSTQESIEMDALYKTKKKPQCPVCNKEFYSEWTLERHKIIHTGLRPFACDLCPVRTNTLGNLKSHRLTHFGIKPYVCPVCSKSFSSKASLTTHMSSHNHRETATASENQEPAPSGTEAPTYDVARVPLKKSKVFACDVCSKVFRQYQSLQIHRRCHTGEKPYKCSICSKTFSSPGNLCVHKKIHTGEKSFSCTLCSKSFRTSGILKCHMFTHTNVRSFVCDVCNRAFKHPSNLKAHKSRHSHNGPVTPPESAAGTVSVLPKPSDSATAIPDTISSTIEQVAAYARQHSVSTFPSFDSFSEQRQLNINNHDLVTSIDLIKKALLPKHIQPYSNFHLNNHTGFLNSAAPHGVWNGGPEELELGEVVRPKKLKKPYSCDVCGKPFSTSGSLKIHRTIHTGEKPYSCDICSKVFRTQGNFKTHVRTHSGQKPYQCEICLKRFTNSGNLRSHMTSHSNLRPFICNICGKSYRTAAILRLHVKSHDK